MDQNGANAPLTAPTDVGAILILLPPKVAFGEVMTILGDDQSEIIPVVIHRIVETAHPLHAEAININCHCIILSASVSVWFRTQPGLGTAPSPRESCPEGAP